MRIPDPGRPSQCSKKCRSVEGFLDFSIEGFRYVVHDEPATAVPDSTNGMCRIGKGNWSEAIN